MTKTPVMIEFNVAINSDLRDVLNRIARELDTDNMLRLIQYAATLRG